MSIRLDYATKVWCVVLDCTRQVVYISVSLQQCKEKYPEALLYGKEQGKFLTWDVIKLSQAFEELSNTVISRARPIIQPIYSSIYLVNSP